MQVLVCAPFQSEINLSSQLGPSAIDIVISTLVVMKTAQALSTASNRMLGVSRAPGSSGQAPVPAAEGTHCQTDFPVKIHLSLVASTPEMICSSGAAAVQSLTLHFPPRDTMAVS